MGKKINDSFMIGEFKIKNRICVPPMVIFNNDRPDGSVTDECVEHYRRLAKGGPGLIIQEATCINPDGMLAPNQIGIWDDSQVSDLSKIVEAVHAENTTIFVQIHHAGIVGVSKQPVCPSPYVHKKADGTSVTGKELTIDEIHGIQQDFVDAARRAYEAGFDGIELHGCHSYLISQFLNNRVNTRSDIYGTNPILFVTEIMDGIRKMTSEKFIIGIRLGGFEPDLTAGIEHAKALDAKGIDFIDVSYGFSPELDVEKPKDFPYADIIYAAGEIKKNVKAPVFAVYAIHTQQDAQQILELTGVDMVDIGRSVLVDPNWANKVLKNEEPGKCLLCKKCTVISGQCAGRKLMERKAAN